MKKLVAAIAVAMVTAGSTPALARNGMKTGYDGGCIALEADCHTAIPELKICKVLRLGDGSLALEMDGPNGSTCRKLTSDEIKWLEDILLDGETDTAGKRNELEEFFLSRYMLDISAAAKRTGSVNDAGGGGKIPAWLLPVILIGAVIGNGESGRKPARKRERQKYIYNSHGRTFGSYTEMRDYERRYWD